MDKPNLFIVGAAKAGTTSLYHYLSQHPDVYMSPVKEPHYFSNVESADNSDYLPPEQGKTYHTRIIKNLQDYLNLFKTDTPYLIKGEASPSYLWDTEAASNIRKFNPDARIVIILREPGARAYSHFQMNLSLGLEKHRDFIKAVNADKSNSNKRWGISHLYLDLSFYSEQLKKYFQEFPATQVFVLKFEDLIKDPVTEIKKVCSFLDIEPELANNFQLSKKNETKYLKSPVVNRILFTIKNNFILKKIKDRITPNLKDKLKNAVYEKDSAKKQQTSMTKEIRDFLNLELETEKNILASQYKIYWED